jgi:hypothetical protein
VVSAEADLILLVHPHQNISGDVGENITDHENKIKALFGRTHYYYK